MISDLTIADAKLGHRIRTANETIAECIELFVSGLNAREIGEITGIRTNLVDRWINLHYFGYRGDDGAILRLTSKV